MTSNFGPELQQYNALALEIHKRIYAEEDPMVLNAWLAAQVAKLGGTVQDNAIMTWEESFDYYDALLEKRAKLNSIPVNERKLLDWPWASWNKLIDPLEPGILTAITAGDGQGKTIVAECLAEYWARRGMRVVFMHFELNRDIMLDRRGTRQTGIDRRVLKQGDFHNGELVKVGDSRKRLLQWPGGITYVHAPGWSMEKALGTLRSLQADGLCDIVMIDYLEKVSASDVQRKLYGGNLYQREADNVEQLKNFGESSDVPVVMLAQLNKDGKSSGFENMDRTNMRGAGEKSEKANVVIMLHREKENGGYSRTVNVKIDKNTLGATGSFTQMMIPERFDIADLDITRVELN